MAPTDVVPKPPTSPRPLNTSPSSPVLPAHKQMEHVQQLLELLKAVQALPAPGDAAKTEEIPGDEQGAMIRASKLEFKTINEM